MTVNHVRRRQSYRDQPVNLARRRTEHVTALMALRDHLANAHACYEAHALNEALDILQQMLEIEESIKTLAPRIFEERWSDWVQRDAELQHDEQHPHDKCRICTMRQVAMQPRSA